MNNPLYDFFPHTEKITSMRSNQREALDKLWECIERGDTKITLCAPVGSGKSALGDTIFNYYTSLGKKCIYTSPLNALVDQVDASGFQGVCTLKGRARYPCLAGKKNAGEGWCQDERCPSSKRKRECKKTPYGACHTCVCWKCIYRETFNKFKHADKGNTNFSLMLMSVDNNPDVIAIDECDSAESFIRLHYGVTIPKLIDDVNFKNHIEPLKEYCEELSISIEAIGPESEFTTDAQLNERKELINMQEKITSMLIDVENHHELWIVTVKRDSQKTHYEPVTIDRFLDPLLEGKIVFMMSATPPVFPGYSRVEVDSIFPIETRQWSYHPLGKMSMKYRDATIPKLAYWLSTLKGKTLVHCVSYATAQKVSDALRILGIFPLLQVNHNGGDEHTTNRYDAVNAFVTASDLNKIMLSVKLDRGVDFWQPEIVNTVICVLPYPNPTEPLTKAKNRLMGSGWQAEQMSRDISQMMGRIFRNEKLGIYQGQPVPKRGYIVASEWWYWYAHNKKLFPKWFIESELKDVKT